MIVGSSLGCISIRLLILVPRDIFVPTGILSTNSRYIIPLLVNIIKLSTVLVRMTIEVISSWVFTPTPLRFCVLNDVAGIRLISPLSVITTTHFSGSTSGSSSFSLTIVIFSSLVRRASPYFLTSSANLLCNSGIGLLQIASSVINNAFNSRCSFSNVAFSKCDNLDNFISKIACACLSLKLYLFCKIDLAWLGDSACLISLINSSIIDNAFNNPVIICNLSFVFIISNSASLIIHFLL